MHKYVWSVLLIMWAATFAVAAGGDTAKPKAGKRAKLLYVTHSAGFKHEAVVWSQPILKRMAEESGAYDLTMTEDLDVFTPAKLHEFAAVMFYTTGELPMSEAQKKAFTEFVRSGGGFVGIHSATDTFYMWPEYHQIIGGYFNGHPWNQKITVEVVEPMNPLVAFLGKSFEISDEIYQHNDFLARDSQVLLRLDPSSVDTKKSGVVRRYYGWPLAWTRTYGKGRIYYNALGHAREVWENSRYQQMLLNGIRWVMKQLWP